MPKKFVQGSRKFVKTLRYDFLQIYQLQKARENAVCKKSSMESDVKFFKSLSITNILQSFIVRITVGAADGLRAELKMRNQDPRLAGGGNLYES